MSMFTRVWEETSRLADGAAGRASGGPRVAPLL